MQISPESEVSLDQVLAAGVAVWPDRGPRILQITGEDAQDFLQRMTTHDMRLLNGDTSVTTALLSGIGRLLSVFTVIPDAQGFWLSAPPGEAEALRAALQGNIFFMDQVTVTDVSAQWQCLQLHGAGADRVLALLGFADLEPREGATARVGDLICVYHDALELPGYSLLVPVARVSQTLFALQQGHGILMQDWDAYHWLRISAGRGGFGTEFTDDFNPLEVGLAWLCAEGKGCYPGQEIIARQVTYDKITRQLVNLEADTPLARGAVVTAGQSRAGKVTSQADATDTGRYIGLAVVSRRYMDTQAEFQVQGRPVTMVQPALAGEPVGDAWTKPGRTGA